MEFDPKLQENLAIQPVFFPENYFNTNKKDEFPFEASSSTNFFQEMNNLDDQLITNVNNPTSNPPYDIQTTCFNTNFAVGNSSNMIDFYECKPLCDPNGGNFLEKFQGGGYLYFSQKNIMEDLIGFNQSNNISVRYQEIKPMNFVVPDENSSITAESGYYKKVGMNKTRVSESTRRPYKRHKKSNVVKGQWTIDEDRLLIQLVEQYGVRKWSNIAQMLPGRIGKQCRERWHNHLRPDIKKDTWSEEEDKVLIQAHTEIGNKWAEIAKRLPGRTENSIKNHWNATKRRQYSKRKCRSKYPRGSILQDYIKSLNLDNPKKVKTTKGSIIDLPTSLDFCPNDHLVPNYEFDEDPNFTFDENMFEESCTIDSLLDQEKFEIEKPLEMDDGDDDDEGKSLPLMDFEVKKEMDLVEMISQATM